MFRLGEQRGHVELGAAQEREAVERAASPEIIENRAEEGEATPDQGERGGALVRGGAPPTAEDVPGRATAPRGIPRPPCHHRQSSLSRLRNGETGQKPETDENRPLQPSEEQGEGEGEGEQGSSVRGQGYLFGLLSGGKRDVAIDAGRGD